MCDEKQRLKAICEALEVAHAKLHYARDAQAGTIILSEYNALSRAAALAEKEGERARRAYETHILEHGC